MNSGLLVQTSDGNGENMMMTREGDDSDAPQLVTSNVAIKTDDIDTDDEATHHDKVMLTPQQVTSNVAMKTDDIDTDDEATNLSYNKEQNSKAERKSRERGIL